MGSAGKNLRLLFSQYKILALFMVIAIIWVFFGQMTEGQFLTSRNFSNLLRQMAITGLVASGMVFVIIAGEIDLSVGSLFGLLGGVAAVLETNFQLPLALNFAIVLALGVAIGMFNGFWVSYFRVPSFIVSLAGMLAFRGILLSVTQGITVQVDSDAFKLIGQGYIPATIGYLIAVALFVFLVYQTMRSRANRTKYALAVPPVWQDGTKLVAAGAVILGFVVTLNSYQGVPIPVLLLLVVLGIFSFMATQTVFGRRIYAIGSNFEATRLSGVNVRFIKMAIFGVLGLMCALAGLVTTARLAAGSPAAGNMGELDAIASCFIGGASSRGGSGTVFGALVGALIMASLDNGMSMMGVDTSWQMIVKGSILLLAVWMDVVSGSNER
jgi:D-xylose transport system permease protein